MRISRRNFLRARIRPRITGHTQTERDTDPPKEAAVGPAPSRAERRQALLRARGRMVARVDRLKCLGSMAQVCTVCIERCPIEGAIRLDGTEPVVDAARCDGCGECERTCPSPLVAIRVLPEGL